MSIPIQEQKILALISGGVCAFPGCGESLVNTDAGEPSVIGQMAHIVAQQRQGPRGRSLMSDTDRDKTSNLILLCGKHHKVIDDHPHVYSVQILRQMKADHERRITEATRRPEPLAPKPLVLETVHSTLLRLSQIPKFVYSAPCDYGERQKQEVAKLLNYGVASHDEYTPFLLRERHLFAFQNLTQYSNPFSKVANPLDAFEIPLEDFCSDPEGKRRFVSLLNSAIAKHCGRRRILFDREHHRYYFVPLELGQDREESYRTLTDRKTSRNVVWNPKKKSTGEGRPFWLHLAADLSFHKLGEKQWCFSIRPERHVTKDGQAPYNPKYIGRKVTKLKARMFNDAYLGEVHFWRDYLSGGKPRFILNFGRQSAIIETNLLPVEVKWEGIPEDIKAFSNQVYEDDLFSFGELQSARGDDEIDYFDDDEDE